MSLLELIDDVQFREYVLDMFFDGCDCKQIIDIIADTQYSRQAQEAGDLIFELMSKRRLNPRPVVSDQFGMPIAPELITANVNRLHSRRYEVHKRAAWLLEQRAKKQSTQET